MSRPLLKPALLGSCAALACGTSHALEWHSTPGVTVGAGEDSNIWLDPLVDRRASSSSLTATADILANAPGLKLHVQPEVRALRYAKGADADRDDAFTNVELALSRERNTVTLSGGYRRESTLTAEFNDTGVLGLEDERTERSMTAAWSYVVGPRGRVNVAASALDVNYDSAGPFSPFVNYDYRVVQLGYQIATNARSAWVLSATRSNLHGAFTDMANTALQARWTHSFTSSLRGEFGLGTFDVRPSSPVDTQRDSGAALSFSVTRDWARWSLQSGGGRDLRPDGRGALVREDAITLDALHRFGLRLSVGLSVRRARVAATEELASVYDRDYSQMGVAAEWRMKERWRLRASLQERMQQLPFAPRASGIGASVSMTYRGR